MSAIRGRKEQYPRYSGNATGAKALPGAPSYNGGKGPSPTGEVEYARGRATRFLPGICLVGRPQVETINVTRPRQLHPDDHLPPIAQVNPPLAVPRNKTKASHSFGQLANEICNGA
jgi:hypothetical protein